MRRRPTLAFIADQRLQALSVRDEIAVAAEDLSWPELPQPLAVELAEAYDRMEAIAKTLVDKHEGQQALLEATQALHRFTRWKYQRHSAP